MEIDPSLRRRIAMLGNVAAFMTSTGKKLIAFHLAMTHDLSTVSQWYGLDVLNAYGPRQRIPATDRARVKKITQLYSPSIPGNRSLDCWKTGGRAASYTRCWNSSRAKAIHAYLAMTMHVRRSGRGPPFRGRASL